MATIDDLYQSFSNVNLKEELPEIVQSVSYHIDELVIAQLNKGEDSTGSKITPVYKSPAYAKKKYWQYNSLPGLGTPDLKLTGALYAGIGVAVTSDTYSIESNVEYANDSSITQYGDNILRLSDASIETFCDESLSPAIQSYISEITGLTFE